MARWRSLITSHRGVFPPLDAAIRWAEVNHFRQLHVSLLLLDAENLAVLGDTNRAATMLDKARVSIGHRTMRDGRIGGRWNFLDGMVLFQQKKVAEGDAAVAAAMRYMASGSHWLLQIGLGDMMAGTTSTPRAAMDIYRDVLRDPSPADWSSDPMESLAVLVTPHPVPYEHWFKVALKRKDWRRPSRSATACGGTAFSVPWPTAGGWRRCAGCWKPPTNVLDTPSKLQRQDLLARYPAYDQLRQKAHALHEQLASMPLATEDREPSREQVQGWPTCSASASSRRSSCGRWRSAASRRG